MITKLQFLKDEAVSMIADLETRLHSMTADELEIVTARLTDLRVEIADRRHAALVAESDRLEAKNSALTGVAKDDPRWATHYPPIGYDYGPHPRFERTYCSQCGGEFGPGAAGFSHCEDHRKKAGNGA